MQLATIEPWKIFASLGVPGLALGVFYMLFRTFKFPMPAVPKNWVGPIVVLFMVLIAGITLFALQKFAPSPNEPTFPFTVFVQGEGGPSDVVLKNSGYVVLDLGGDRRTEAIGEKGQAYFPAIPAIFRNQEVPIGVQSDDFRLSDPNKKYRLDGSSIYLSVQRKAGQPEPVFSKSLTGILVMRIMGDDSLDSLQGELLERLNVELQKDPAGKQIEVHASRETVDESSGLAAAHERARAIGQMVNAKLVIWGRKIGDKKFYPRITMVNAPKAWGATSERTHDVQKIDDLRLPEELVDEPFYLIHFAAGYSYFDQDNYKEALPHFEAALQRQGGSANEIADLQFFTACCDYELGVGQRDMTYKLQEAIGLFEKAAEAYSGDDQKLARTQNNLGIAYAQLPTGSRAANLQKAIAAFEAALPLMTKDDFLLDWATTQTNLGTAYTDLPTGDRAANLQKAIAAFEAALQVRTEKDFPIDWAVTQTNLGVAYAQLHTGDLAANLEKAIAAFEAALRVRTEEDFPLDWARTQTNLGVAYARLPTGDRVANLQKAVTAFEAALRVRTEKDFPIDWATTQNNLGKAYVNLPAGDRAANLQKAIAAFEAALRVRTEKDFPVDWATTTTNLGNAYANLPTGDRAANLQKAIAAFEAALRVKTERDFPVDWAVNQANLGIAYVQLPTGDRAENLKRAKAYLESAMKVYTENGFPNEHSAFAAALAGVELLLRNLTVK